MNLSERVNDGARHIHAIAAIGGYFQVDGDQWEHVGAAYNPNTRGGFFLETGWSAGQGAHRTPQLMLQLS